MSSLKKDKYIIICGNCGKEILTFDMKFVRGEEMFFKKNYKYMDGTSPRKEYKIICPLCKYDPSNIEFLYWLKKAKKANK